MSSDTGSIVDNQMVVVLYFLEETNWIGIRGLTKLTIEGSKANVHC